MSNKDIGVALVTGDSSGLGPATAKALRQAGYRAFGTSRRVVIMLVDDPEESAK
jgi:NADP-dependent 3-hydroxy acid dehydrogenase YdfG